MDLFMFAICYVSFVVALLVVLLFGENPMLMGTPVAWLHWTLTQGPCAILSWLTRRIYGARGERALDAAFETCCDKSNILMQLTYLGILAAGYYMYNTYLFTYLGHNPWVPVYHMYTGTAAVGLCLLAFVWACCSDPGVITEANFKAHDALYQCDDLIFSEKECRTCHFLRPARSKHCSTCNRCVARFDHHCSWINNDVGLLNLRAFLTFLGTNCLMCVYGATLAAAILGGELKARGFYEIKLINYQTGQIIPAYHMPGRVTEFLLVYYPVATAMGLFMLLTVFLMGFFLGYQLYLLSNGKTQYETFRWLDVHLTLIKLERQRLNRPLNRYKWLRVVSWMWDINPPIQMPANLYNQGFWRNLMEVIRPHKALAAALQRHVANEQQHQQQQQQLQQQDVHVARGTLIQQDVAVASASTSASTGVKAQKRSSKKAVS